jgi:drug/metabolite transporter (DMT)-like permease
VAVLSPLAYILVLQALQLAPVSIVAPGREASVVLVGLAGWLLFKEPHPARRLAGAAIVLVGVGLLAASR